MTRLLVVTARELTRDVRARRQVDAALAAGYEVAGLSISHAWETPEPIGAPVTRVRGNRVAGSGLGAGRRPSAPERELRGLYRLLRLARASNRLVRAGVRLGEFDVVHANDLDSLPAALLLARRWRARLVYDAHELYSVAEIDPPRVYRAAALAVERAAARRADVVMTNCPLFAEWLERNLRLRRAPALVLNCPDTIDAEPTHATAAPLRVVYQAAADHTGRPVADLVDAAVHAPDVDVTIRLVDVDAEAVNARIAANGLEERVRLEDPVAPTALVESMRGFDAGVLLNVPQTPNDDLALPGKVFEYMMAGLAVVSARITGVVPVIEAEGAGLTYPPGDGRALGAALQRLADDRALLARLQDRGRELALERYNSERQADELMRAWLPAARSAAS